MDDNGDTLNDLSQYDGAYGGYFEKIWRNEYFRHGDSCNALMADGHVEEFSRDQVTEDGKPELKYYYTGFEEDRVADQG